LRNIFPDPPMIRFFFVFVFFKKVTNEFIDISRPLEEAPG